MIDCKPCGIIKFQDPFAQGCPRIGKYSGPDSSGLWPDLLSTVTCTVGSRAVALYETCGCFYIFGVLLVGVLIRALLFEVYFVAPDSWKLPFKDPGPKNEVNGLLGPQWEAMTP